MMPGLPANTEDRAHRAHWRLVTGLLIVLCGMAMVGQAQVASEAQLKAAYLVNFLKYVEWPDTSPDLTICLFGQSDLMPHLTHYAGRRILGRNLVVRQVENLDALPGCQELFLPRNEQARSVAVLRNIERRPILTVSDGEGFLQWGGAIVLTPRHGQLLFDINTDALQRAGLKASTPMLRLARQVTGHSR